MLNKLTIPMANKQRDVASRENTSDLATLSYLHTC